MHASRSDVVEAFRQTFFDERLRSKDQAIPFQVNLQVIARREPQLVMKLFGDGDLPADPDLDDVQAVVRL